MKRLIAFALVAGLSFATNSGVAQSAEFKASGFWDMSFLWANTTFTRTSSDDTFMAVQRFRPQIDIIASENLKGVVQLEMDSNWGTADYQGWSKGGSLGTDGYDVKVKASYIDYILPDTSISVRLGLQSVILPGFVAGSNVFDDDVAGITVAAQINENVSMVVAWSRPFNDNNLRGVKDNHVRDAADSFTLVLPLTFDGFKLIPWATYAVAGRDSDPWGANDANGDRFYAAPQLLPAVWATAVNWDTVDNADVIWAGLTGEMNLLDPFRAAFDFNYGKLDGVETQLNRSGWYLAGILEYKLDFMTPGLMAWYTSGDDSNITNGSERMPTFSAEWTGTSMGWSDYYSSRGDKAAVMGLDNTGTWGVAAQLKDITFLEDLKHLLRVARYQGTNNTEMARYIQGDKANQARGDRTWSGLYMTTRDSMWEVNLNSVYKIYANLEFGVDMGYMNLHRDKDLWTVADEDRNAYRVETTLRYSF